MRIFTAIPIPQGIKKALDESAREIIRYCDKGRITHIDNHHITLRFLGEVREEELPALNQAVQVTASRFETFNLIINGFGEFKKPDGSIVWIGLKEKPSQLTQLYRNLEDMLEKEGYAKESRPYSPHITLIRQARLSKPLNEIAPPLREGRLEVTQIALMESTHVDGKLTYIPLATYPLKDK